VMHAKMLLASEDTAMREEGAEMMVSYFAGDSLPGAYPMTSPYGYSEIVTTAQTKRQKSLSILSSCPPP